MQNEIRVLAVDDEPAILRLIKLSLRDQGHEVITARTGAEALDLAEQLRPDVAVLDIVMPDTSGIELMRQLRERASMPVILVTAKDTDADKVRGLQEGADDYVVKPFNPEELGARIEAVLRRSVSPSDIDRIVRAGHVEIDLNRRLVTREGQVVSLTRTEWLLLQALASNAGRTLLGAELLSSVWGPEYRDDFQYLRVWVSRLRRKLEDNTSEPRVILTRPGIGYTLNADPPSA